MARAAFHDEATIAKLTQSFTPVLVDGDSEPEFGARYALHYYPSLVFCDAAGNAVRTLDGASPDAFRQAVGELAR